MKTINFTEAMQKSLVDRFVKELKDKFSKGDITGGITIPLNESRKLKDDEKIEIVFERKAYKKMYALIDECDKEVAWHGFVERKSEKRFVINDIAVFPQIVTGSTVDTDDEKYSGWYDKLTDEQFCTLQFHGHSHVNMAVFPSGVDTGYQRSVVEQNQGSFYIFGIFNKSKKYWFNIYDKENNILYENDDITFKVYMDDEEVWARDQIKEFLTEKKYTPNIARPATNPVHYPNSAGAGSLSDFYGSEYYHRQYGGTGQPGKQQDKSKKKNENKNENDFPIDWDKFFD